jgi:exodeoxyribonuclease-3
MRELEREKPVVVCGDLNVSHQAIDLARPKDNVKNAGFTPEERQGFQNFVDAGFVDTFREFEPGGGHYTWWTWRLNARERNVGWRIDYVLVSGSLRPRLTGAEILGSIHGSDHCPVAAVLVDSA